MKPKITHQKATAAGVATNIATSKNGYKEIISVRPSKFHFTEAIATPCRDGGRAIISGRSVLRAVCIGRLWDEVTGKTILS